LVLADPEAAFLEHLDSVQPYFARLQEGRRAITAVAESDALILAGENRMSELNSGISLLDHTIARFGRKNAVGKQELIAQRMTLVQERASLRPQLDAARGARMGPMQRRKMFEEFEKQRTEFLDKARYARPAADRVLAQYAELAKDKAVAQALKDLRQSTKARIELGPSPRFKSAYREFQAAVTGAKTPDELMKEYAERRQGKGPGDATPKRGKTRSSTP
jgi:hypothetical protein